MHFHKLASLSIVAAIWAVGASQTIPPERLNGLSWRLIGPFRGGRALAVCGVPGKPEKFYFGGVGGGVWVTENAGRTWTPIFDKEPVASIGAIAVAPSDPNVVYVGSGEADMRSDIQQGNGMYKSVDAGKTWSRIGLYDTRQIGKILVDPHDANVVYVAALGHQYGPNEERGVFKSTDGGKSWTKSLYKNPNIGAIDLAMDPNDSGLIYATMWSTRRPPWNTYPPTNGPGSGLYKSENAGQTWTQITGHGFPASTGRIGLAVSPTDRDRIYAIADSDDPKQGGVYRSDDGGETWSHTSGDNRIWGRGWYFMGITADPKNPDTVYVMNTSTYRSTDGGKTFNAIKGAPGGDDYHTMWIYPDDPDRMILACDQGVVVSVDGAKTWSSWYNQPTGQFYHVVADNRFPYWVYGAQQDSGAYAVPSRSIHSGISAMDARPIDVGGESGTIAPDPLHPGTLLGNNGSKERLDVAWEQNNDPTILLPGTAWRSNWTQPITVSPLDPHVFYMSHQQIFRSADSGMSWKIISPDLSRKKLFVPPNLDPASVKNNPNGDHPGVVYWIAPSPVKKGTIWAGTDDGLIWLTRDEGVHWVDVTPPDIHPWSKIGVIEASRADANSAVVAVDRHRLDDNHPYIYRTDDGGKHWKLIVNGLPNMFVNVVRQHPVWGRILLAGTDTGVFVSFDRGDHWQSLQLNLPAASVRDIVFAGNDIVLGTHGRAIWVLDDANLLPFADKANAVALGSPAYLFQRAGTFGFGAFDEGTPLPPEEPQGANPPWGAIVDYTLASSSSVVLTIEDASGKRIRRISSDDPIPHVDANHLDIPAYWVKPALTLGTSSGGHRYVWDLRYADAGGPTVPPGRYRVSIALGDGSVSQSNLEVLRDPRLSATDADLRLQFDTALAIRSELALIEDATKRANALLKSGKLNPADTATISQIVGRPGARRRRQAPPSGPTDSLGAIAGVMRGIYDAIESAPAAPNPTFVNAFHELRAKASASIAKVNALTHR